jgi:chitinase
MTSQEGSAMSAVKAWTGAGFAADQVILGVASYGHSFHVDNTNALDASGNLKLYPSFDKSQQPAGDKWDSTATGTDVCGNPNVVGGIFDFWGLIDGGFLNKDGTAASGIDYTFDSCSKTVSVPYLIVEAMTYLFVDDFNLALRIQPDFAGDGILR